ncbi:response regulator [Terrilactibacillus laevilacticus]|uniref:response regulator n=1 Tax=Terrilactibacillus laevilacticus TaxID=1380157 RepID=UPI001FE4EA41|nr:response regulator [Terrilactibacillus laevilacticus]
MLLFRVMLIDDEEDALDLLEILLKEIENITVVGRYSDPVQALEAIERIPFDIVFVDIEMPKLKGTQVARIIKEINPQIMIVFTTAYSEYAVEAFEIQSLDYLLKPFSLERLKMSISRMKDVAPERINLSHHTNYNIQCMGGFNLYLPTFNKERRTLAWKTNKEKEVCAFLYHYSEKTVDTDLIIESIWPEYDVKKAKNYLYTCLSYLRKDLLENKIPARMMKEGKGFALNTDGLESDVRLFMKIIAKIMTNEEVGEEIYSQLNTIYKGEYMEGCDYHWARSKQIELNGIYIRALRKLYLYFKTQNNSELIEDVLQRIVKILPDSELDGRELIKFYMESGKRHEAVNVYKQLKEYVHHQLGIQLENETVQLYKQVIQN